MSEVRELPPNAPPGVGTRAIPVHPRWDDFKIDDKPLFATCREYLDSAGNLAAQARTLADGEHGDAQLTPPPPEAPNFRLPAFRQCGASWRCFGTPLWLFMQDIEI